jgi:hypothetical protein
VSEDRTKEDNAFDAEQLAALARPSLPPTQDRDDDDDDDDGPLDLKALTASMVPPAASDEPADDNDDDDDARVSMAAASGASSTSADSSSSAKVAGTKSSKGKSSKGKSAKGKSSKGKSSKGKSSGKSSGKSAEPKDDEKKAVVAVAAAVEEPQSGGSGKMLIALIAVLGIGGVVFALTQNAEPEQQASLYPPASETTATQREPARVEDTTPEETPEPAAADEAVEAPLPDETEGETEAEPATTEAAPAEAEPTGDRRARRRETSMAGAAATMESPEATDTATMEVAVAPSMEAETMAAEPTMEQSSSMDDMDDLLTRALGGTPSAGGTMTEATMEVAMEDRSSLPETPSRPAVTRALGGLMARMRQCAGDQVGMATARIRVNNNGQVVSANIGGSPFGGTPQGACMERVVQTARFPRFQRTHFDVTYPFSIRAIR